MSLNEKVVCMILCSVFVSDTRVIREAKTLAKSGYEVIIFAFHKEGLRQSEEMHGFTVNRIHLTFGKLPEYELFQFLKYLEFVSRCCIRVKKGEPTVCHCHDLEALMIGHLVTRSNKCKLIYDSHELWGDPRYLSFSRPFYPKIVSFILRKLEHFIMKKANAVITVSDSIGDFIAKQNEIRKPYVIKNVPNLVKDRKSDRIREKISIIGDRRKIILYQGGIKHGRGLENLIISTQWIDNAVLVILGDGPIKEDLEDLAIKHKVRNKIRFMKGVPPEEVLSYTCSADVGIMPVENVSLSYYYCLPNKLFEYLMAGLPVAVSNFPEMARIVKKYKVGEVFNPDRPQDISRAINALLNDPVRYERCKANTKKVNRDYNWENEEKKLLEVYEELLKP